MVIENLFELLEGDPDSGGYWLLALLDGPDYINMIVNGISNQYMEGDIVSYSDNTKIEFEEEVYASLEFHYVVSCKRDTLSQDYAVVPVVVQPAPDFGGSGGYKRRSYYSDAVKVANYGDYFGFYTHVNDVDIRNFEVDGQNIMSVYSPILANSTSTGVFNTVNSKYASNLVDTLNFMITSYPGITSQEIKFNYRPTLLDCDGLPAYFEICWRVNTFSIELSPGLKGYSTNAYPAGPNWTKVKYTQDGIEMYSANANQWFTYNPSDHNNPIYGESCPDYLPIGVRESYFNISGC